MDHHRLYSLILEYCLNKPGAYFDDPFGAFYATIKIKKANKSRIFAELFELNNDLKMTFSADESTTELLRASYPLKIEKGWHCPPMQAKYKSTVSVDAFSEEELYRFIDLSYERARMKLKLS